MQLRGARLADAETIARYHHQCWIEAYAGLVPADQLAALTVEHFVARWREVLDERPDDVTVAVVDDSPVGHAALEGATLTSLYVDPQHWRGGLGRVLLATAEAQLRDRGVETGELWTIVGNERALTLYRSEGWAPDGTIELHHSSAGIEISEMRLLKSLSVASG